MTQRYDITLTSREYNDILLALAATSCERYRAASCSKVNGELTKYGRVVERRAESLDRTRSSLIRKADAARASNR